MIDWEERCTLLTLALGELINIKFSKTLMFVYWIMILIPPLSLPCIAASEKLDDMLSAFGYVPLIGVCTISSSEVYWWLELLTFYLPLFAVLVFLGYKWNIKGNK